MEIKRDITDELSVGEQLRQAQKMEVVGRMASGIAHDFGNLLMVIDGTAELALHESPDRNPVRHLNSIRTAAAKATRMTKQLLSFGRKRPVNFESVEINGLIAGMESMFKQTAGQGFRIATNLDPASVMVHADSNEIEHILLNLVANARDAMEEGGTITIETCGYQSVASVKGVAPRPHALLSVRDTGKGMDEDTREHAFDPFFTTKAPGAGTGLGLSSVHRSVERHGGTILIDSQVGSGTSIQVFLPQEEADMADDTEISRSSLRTILIVEDESPVRELVKACLVAEGFRVLEAENASKAEDISLGYSGTIDLLLTDVVMPERNGVSLATSLRSSRRDMEVLFMTGSPGELALLTDGADVPYVEKPFTANYLIERVRQILRAARNRTN